MRVVSLSFVSVAACGAVLLAQVSTPDTLTVSLAPRYRGKSVTVCGVVAQVSCSDDGISLRVDGLDSPLFRFFIPTTERGRFEVNGANQLDEQPVCATGQVERTKGGDPRGCW